MSSRNTFAIDEHISDLPRGVRLRVRCFRRDADNQLQRRAIWDKLIADLQGEVKAEGQEHNLRALIAVSDYLGTVDGEVMAIYNSCSNFPTAVNYWRKNEVRIWKKILKILDQWVP